MKIRTDTNTLTIRTNKWEEKTKSLVPIRITTLIQIHIWYSLLLYSTPVMLYCQPSPHESEDSSYTIDKCMWDRKLCTFLHSATFNACWFFFFSSFFSFLKRIHVEEHSMCQNRYEINYLLRYFSIHLTQYTHLAYNFVTWFVSVEHFTFAYTYIRVVVVVAVCLAFPNFVRNDNRWNVVVWWDGREQLHKYKINKRDANRKENISALCCNVVCGHGGVEYAALTRVRI